MSVVLGALFGTGKVADLHVHADTDKFLIWLAVLAVVFFAIPIVLVIAITVHVEKRRKHE